MKFEKTEVWGFEHAIRGMRNPLESWEKSDSGYPEFGNNFNNCTEFIVRNNDLELMLKLIKAGSEHRKFLRQIFISVDITAPLFWWKEFDTYKIGTTANSCSTMHKLASTPITKDCFEMDDFIDFTFVIQEDEICAEFYNSKREWESEIRMLEALRVQYNKTKEMKYWKELIRKLPESWLQKRTITMNYENILNMYQQRKYHELTEWSIDFCYWCESLPYFKEFSK